MNITSVRIKKIKSYNPNILGVASIELENCLIINDLLLVQGRNRRLVKFPNKKMEYRRLNEDNSGYDINVGHTDIVHPSTKEFRQQVEETLFKIYDEEVINNEQNN